MVLYLYSKQLVKLSQGHMLVLHLPPGVLDGMNTALQEVGGRRRELRKGTMPSQSHSYQLVQEDALHGHRLQHWGGGKNRVDSLKNVLISGNITSTAAEKLHIGLQTYKLLALHLQPLRPESNGKVKGRFGSAWITPSGSRGR